MKHKLYFFIICCTHFALATVGYLSLYISIPISIILTLVAMKRITLKIDWSVIIHLCMYGVYVLNGKSVQNLHLLFGALLVVIYSSQKQKALFKTSTVQLEVNEKLVEFNRTFQEVRKERHDYLKHVSAIAYLLEKDKVNEAKIYMQGLVKRYEQTNLSLKGEQGAVAAVLYTNYEKARSHNIAINYLFETPVSNLSLPSDEIVQLIGNILENAIDASIEWQTKYNKQAFIELSLRKKSGLYLLTCSNNTIPLPKEIADQLFAKTGVTTKPNHNGLGTSIIRQIIEQHNGYLEFIAEKQTFTITCKIPNVIS
ncbi:sensor histidine kinase [Solibacillus isronensis]|uniref:sensor histidine kinase n=1 Tax=Solibacillus isronensis TaxID=412383 RepID=UPI00203BB3A5|nr:GHKL domain-containing protein [Solibacillus isronensis]MCM3723625.1 GHKL domain-containing protein [Solibacillus isronensis]